MPSPYLTAAQAAEALNISLPTLYAYVSRGLIRSEAAGSAKRRRRYRAEDVRALKQRKELRRNPTKAVEGALHWGEPVMESAITMIADGRLYYHGHDAVALAESRSIEEVAALLWRGDLAVGDALFAKKMRLPPRCLAVRKHLRDIATIEALQILISLAAVDDIAGCDLRPAAVAQTGARILSLMSAFVSGGIGEGESIAQGLQSAWTPRKPKAADLINTALILCADHELNVSSFTARCIASAGSTPYAVVVGGLTALQGVKHGRATERVEALLCEARTPHGVAKVMAAHLKRGDRIPGFGHPLYPDGDPRGRMLLQAVERNFHKSAALAFADAACDAAMRLIGDRPSIDFALVIAARALGLRADGAVSLFAIGRTVGWLGHAIEQYQRNRIIRPRARYVGELPR
ncbi:MAG TPA: citrate synthase family protein [Candidatus Binatia bacterium]|nr:citrate synthase family protein [Candidatus Binatia bacterium]